MQSPFLADESLEAPQTVSTSPDPALLDQLNELIEQGVRAKQEAERQKALYDALRDQVCALLRDLGERNVETTAGKARLKETRSGWKFSEATEKLSEQLKLQQDIEKRTGVARSTKTTLSADLFA